jgi:hypothetical protein
VANPRSADRLARGCPPKVLIIMIPQLPPNYYPFSVPLIMEFTTSILHRVYIVASIVGVFITYDEAKSNVYAKVSAAHAYLVSMKIHKTFARRVERFLEMHHAFQLCVIPNQESRLPESMHNRLKYHNCYPTLEYMKLDTHCTENQLTLLSTLLEEILVPQGDSIVCQGEVVDGIYIMADGIGNLHNQGGTKWIVIRGS